MIFCRASPTRNGSRYWQLSDPAQVFTNLVPTTMSLGKRKRDTQVVSRTTAAPHPHESHAQDSVDSTDIFRRHFEAAFAPLPDKTDDKEEADSEESSEELSEYSHAESEVSEWSGLSESGNDSPVVEVIDHTVAQNGEDDEFHRARQKAFMVRPCRLREFTWVVVAC